MRDPKTFLTKFDLNVVSELFIVASLLETDSDVLQVMVRTQHMVPLYYIVLFTAVHLI